jgi:hypothetical protein
VGSACLEEEEVPWQLKTDIDRRSENRFCDVQQWNFEYHEQPYTGVYNAISIRNSHSKTSILALLVGPMVHLYRETLNSVQRAYKINASLQ